MKEEIIAKAYAQSIIELGIANSVDVAKELTTLTELINKSNEFETLLFLDVFSAEEKLSIVDIAIEKLGLSAIIKNTIHFLVQEKRIGLLPMIFKNIIVIDDHNRGFLKGVIEGANEEVSSEFKAKLEKFLEAKLGLKPVLSYTQNNNLSAGYRVTVEDLQLDATLENQLEQFKESVLNNR